MGGFQVELYVFFGPDSHLQCCSDLTGRERKGGFNILRSVSACNQTPPLLLLSYPRFRRERKTGRCSSPPAADFRNEENRRREVKRETHAHTYARIL